MKKRIHKFAKALLSGILALALFIQGASDFSLEANAARVEGKYTYFTLWDYEIPDGSTRTTITGTTDAITELSRVCFEAKFKFQFGNENNGFQIGGENSGIKVYCTQSQLRVENRIVGSTEYGQWLDINALGADYLPVKLQFDKVGTTLYVKVYVNGGFGQNFTCKNVSDIGTDIVLFGGGDELYYKSIGEQEEAWVDSRAYNLADGPYIVADGFSVEKAGEAIADAITLTTPGDYVVKKPGPLYLNKQKVSLYQIGDVNLDGTCADAADLEKLKELLSAKTQSYDLACAADYAADLNNDEKVGFSDLQLMQQIVNSEKSLKEIENIYHVPAISYDYIGGDEVMPIVGYYGPYRRGTVYDYYSDEIYQLVKGSGINLINYSWNHIGESDDILTALAYGEKYGIGYFIDDWNLNPEYDPKTGALAEGEKLTEEEFSTQIGTYATHENWLGIHVKDEPFDNSSSGSEERKLKYFDDAASLLNSYSNTLGFVNAVPSDADVTYIGDNGYYEYLTAMVDDTNSRVVSCDDYPFGTKKKTVKNAGVYFASLAATRKVAMERDLPFWFYVMAGGDFRDGAKDSATVVDKQPTEAESHWNIGTALAFGAKGISWFTLIQPDHFANDSTKENGKDYDRNGLIGADGTTTPFYYYAQDINNHIAKVDEVLMKAKSTGIMATEGYAKTQVQDGGLELLPSTEKLSSITTEDTTYGALVGCFDYHETEAFYVVNYNVDEKQTVTLNFNDHYDYRMIVGTSTKYKSGESCTLTLEPGRGALVVLEDRSICYELSEYRSGGINRVPDAMPGYVFAGWFKDEACTIAVESTTRTGVAYAKFVSNQMLDVSAQLKAGTTATSKSTDIRFNTMVDIDKYQKVGFQVVLGTEAAKDIPATGLCEELFATIIGGKNIPFVVKYASRMMSAYFKTGVLKSIPNAKFDTPLTVTPYWVTLDGTTVYGTTRLKTVNMGY